MLGTIELFFAKASALPKIMQKQLEAHCKLYTQRIKELDLENKELKDTVYCLRVELEKQKNRMAKQQKCQVFTTKTNTI